MKNLFSMLRRLLAEENIEFLSSLGAESLEIIQPRLMPEGIKSAYFWLIPYYTGKHPDRNVSLYSVSRDYHLFSHHISAKIKPLLEKEFPGEGFYFFCDSSPVNEVAAAAKCGLGVIGKNRLLINEKYGSYVFIGSLLTTLNPEVKESEFKTVGGCINCGACEKICGFLGGKSDVCFSELNQKKQVTETELLTIHSRKIRWGCDDCQEICPMNRRAQNTPIGFFYEDIIENVTCGYIDSLSKIELKQRAYGWRGRAIIKRNIE